ncbi:MAG: uroporphyrinogen-III C-methyltransferase [Actinomycetota bacterium]
MGGGIVYLVGAGPGDPGLITRRGAEVLGRADVVLYDRLVHPDLLKLAPNARCVDVGKRPGESGSGQARIHELLVEEAERGSVVVRLKGGDPFVFGRGGEEAEHLVAHGVLFEIVPGVTSAVAAPAYAGIPLTHREHASWVALATGHEDPTKDESSLHWASLARAPVAVFLMGIERLATISDKLQAEGKPADTPAAVVSSGTLPRQRVVRASLEKIADAVARAEIRPPAILVVGGTVPLAEQLDWFARRPLASKRVFVTRTRAQAGRLSALLREAGAEALEFPAIRVEPLPAEEYAQLDDELASLSGYHWVGFTSANAVDAVWTRLTEGGRDARALGGVRIAALGPATADALRGRGLVADLMPPQFTSDALAEALGSPDATSRMLLPRAVEAPADLPETLRERGWECVSPPAYRTVVDGSSVAEGRIALDEGVDAILFTAGSTVRNFVDLWGPPPPGCVVCCMGPRTAAVAGELGVHVDAVAAEQTLEGLVAALVAAVGR